MQSQYRGSGSNGTENSDKDWGPRGALLLTLPFSADSRFGASWFASNCDRSAPLTLRTDLLQKPPHYLLHHQMVSGGRYRLTRLPVPLLLTGQSLPSLHNVLPDCCSMEEDDKGAETDRGKCKQPASTAADLEPSRRSSPVSRLTSKMPKRTGWRSEGTAPLSPRNERRPNR